MQYSRFFQQSISVAVLTGLLFTSSQCLANYFWDADTVYNNSKSYAYGKLLANNNEVKTISTSRLQMWVDARDRISAQSGTYTKLLLSDQPILNAWASMSAIFRQESGQMSRIFFHYLYIQYLAISGNFFNFHMGVLWPPKNIKNPTTKCRCYV